MSSDADDQMRLEDWEGGEKDLEAEKQRRRNALRAHQEEQGKLGGNRRPRA